MNREDINRYPFVYFASLRFKVFSFKNAPAIVLTKYSLILYNYKRIKDISRRVILCQRKSCHY